jgi:hypothetical protein
MITLTDTIAEKAAASRATYQRSAERFGRNVALLTLENLAITISGGWLRMGRVRDEPYTCLQDSTRFIAQLRKEPRRPDLLTFMQPIGDQTPHHPYYHEDEGWGVLNITTYKDYWKNKIRTHTRNHIRKAEKKGVEVRQIPFDENLVHGVKAIYDECPVRQGRPFWHYQEDHETVRSGLATFLECSDFIGAFWEDQLIGFIKLTSDGRTAGLMHIISMIAHRDKAPSDALVAKAVELCAEKKISHLHYALWSTGGFGTFRENHGFERHNVPRYYIPLTAKGSLMLRFGLHQRLVDRLPAKLRERMVTARNRWNALRYRPGAGDG